MIIAVRFVKTVRNWVFSPIKHDLNANKQLEDINSHLRILRVSFKMKILQQYAPKAEKETIPVIFRKFH